MKFKILLPLWLLPLSLFPGNTSLHAQLNVTYPEKVVGLAPLTFDRSTASQESVEKFWHYIFDALFNTKRFKVVDRLDGYKNIVVEKRIQSGGDFVDGKVVKQGKLQGATMMVFGHVMTAQSIESKSTNGTSTYNADLSIAIKIIDVETSEILASVLVTPSGTSKMDDVVKSSKGLMSLFSSNACSGATPQQALDKCMSNIEKYIRQFVTENFPVEMRIFQTRPSENGKYTEYLLIGGGTDGTFREKQKLSVTRTEKINANGKTLKYTNEVVKFEIVRLAEDFIVCKVVKADQDKEGKLNEHLKLDPQSVKVVELKSKW